MNIYCIYLITLAVDYVVGIIKALQGKSEKGAFTSSNFKMLSLRKCATALAICVIAYVLGCLNVVGEAVVLTVFIFVEIWSILENLTYMGVHIPTRIKEIIKKEIDKNE